MLFRSLSGGTTGSSGGIASLGGGTGAGGVVGAGGVTGVGGVVGAGGDTGIDGGGGDEPCSPAKTITSSGSGSSSGNSGSFETKDAFCFRTPDNISGWGCSNLTGRTLKVNGVAETCAALPLPAKINGYYYFDVTAGDVDYASIYWY